MEWLKQILEGIKAGDDGTIKVDTIQKSIQAEMAKHYVPKIDFNDAKGKLKEANETIETLKNENGDNTTLQTKITAYETKISELESENSTIKKTITIKEGLASMGCQDPDYVIYKQGGIEKFSFTDDGKVVGLKEVAETIKENAPYVFKQEEQKKPDYKPKKGEDLGTKNPFDKDNFNLTEQGKLLRENPEQAKTLAEAAGVKI